MGRTRGRDLHQSEPFPNFSGTFGFALLWELADLEFDISNARIPFSRSLDAGQRRSFAYEGLCASQMELSLTRPIG
jgi:hypothetical protein